MTNLFELEDTNFTIGCGLITIMGMDIGCLGITIIDAWYSIVMGLLP